MFIQTSRLAGVVTVIWSCGVHKVGSWLSRRPSREENRGPSLPCKDYPTEQKRLLGHISLPWWALWGVAGFYVMGTIRSGEAKWRSMED